MILHPSLHPPGIHPELDPEEVAPVEGGSLDPDGLDGVSWRQLDGRHETAPELLQAPGVEQLEVAPLLVRREPGHVGHQERLLRHPIGTSERFLVGLGVNEVPLHPHRAQHEPAQLDGRHRSGQAKLDAPGGVGISDLCPSGAPEEAGGPPLRVPSVEAYAFVGGIGPDQHRARGLRLEVDLNGIVPGVAVEPRLVALIGGGVVQLGIGKCEYRLNRLL